MTDYEARVICDSVSPDGVRLTTVVATFPRFVLAEVNTHRMLSRNSASSRAVPVEKRVAAVKAAPFVPGSFGKNQKGMQAREELEPTANILARTVWEGAAQDAVSRAKQLSDLEVHKQYANRVMEPYCWHTAVITATDWKNFFALRCHPDAQPEFRIVAEMIEAAMAASTPRPVGFGDWHLPFVEEDEFEFTSNPHLAREALARLKKASVARCARVSALTHEGKRDIEKDLELYDRLLNARPMHASPFEHVATPWTHYADRLEQYERSVARHEALGEPVPVWVRQALYCANFRGWVQLRHQMPGESVPF